ncbi:hypothetical protein OWV82_007532 [Melia azedarach]|uniref:Uncharacterized protein n=1 Tax=Melia azedarach TaxID=155640 RepID=A0ACC1Y759_MELAZ|nr:hypothetical protein OWV82_007532 [Melia azedarach]
MRLLYHEEEGSGIEREEVPLPASVHQEDNSILETSESEREKEKKEEEEEGCTCEAFLVGACCVLVSSLLCFCCLCCGYAREEVAERVKNRAIEYFFDN